MAPFRPTNLNKRVYPGNASVIGPTVQTTLGLSTTTCCSTTNFCAACCLTALALGCRCSFCSCPCCDICCCCACTICTPSTPSGIWSSSEQYEAATRSAWSGITSSSTAAVCLCCVNVGFAATGSVTDFKGHFICCGPSTTKWFTAPSCTNVSRSFYCRGDAVTVANSCMGSCGWFVPPIAQAQNPGWVCRNYWESFPGTFWSDTPCGAPGNYGSAVYGSSGSGASRPKSQSLNVRAFRCTPS